MSEIQPLLLFDTTAILSTKTMQWQEWSHFGVCVLPLAVFEEVEFLTHRASDPVEETTAREFLRFNMGGEFEISDATALVKGQEERDPSLSKRARLEQSTAECAYALAKQQSNTVVVLVTNARPLVQRIQELQVANLSAVSVAELLQWIRVQQRPRMVEQSLKRMPGVPVPAISIRTDTGAQQKTPARRTVQQRIPAQQSGSSRSRQSGAGKIRGTFNAIQILLAFFILGSTGMVAWRAVDPEGSEQIWQLLRLPDIPAFDIAPPGAPEP